MSKLPLRKLVVVGDGSVGKTSVIQKYVNNLFEDTIATVGVDFNNKDITLSDGTQVKIQIWDTAGQEKFKALTTQYYRRAQGIILFYDVTNKESFSHLQNWLESISNNTKVKIPVILIANKCDLEPRVQRSLAEEFAKEKQLHLFFTSAKTGENIEEAFRKITEMAMQVEVAQPSTPVKITEEKKKGCCFR